METIRQWWAASPQVHIFHVITFEKCVISPRISSPLLLILSKFSVQDIREFTTPWMSSLLYDFMEFYDEKDVPRSSGRTSSLGTKMAELDDSSFENVIFCNKRLYFVHASTIGGTMRCM
jgi:hypothetical protein